VLLLLLVAVCCFGCKLRSTATASIDDDRDGNLLLKNRNAFVVVRVQMREKNHRMNAWDGERESQKISDSQKPKRWLGGDAGVGVPIRTTNEESRSGRRHTRTRTHTHDSHCVPSCLLHQRLHLLHQTQTHSDEEYPNDVRACTYVVRTSRRMVLRLQVANTALLLPLLLWLSSSSGGRPVLAGAGVAIVAVAVAAGEAEDDDECCPTTWGGWNPTGPLLQDCDGGRCLASSSFLLLVALVASVGVVIVGT
jgi:hypothetical protein